MPEGSNDTKVSWLKESIDNIFKQIGEINKEISSIKERLAKHKGAPCDGLLAVRQDLRDHLNDHKKGRDRWWAVAIKLGCALIIWIAGTAATVVLALKFAGGAL